MLCQLLRVPLRMLPKRIVHHWWMGSKSGGPLNADGVVGEAPSETSVGPSFLARVANAGPHRPRILNRWMLGSYVLSQEWDRPSADTVALGLEAA